ncbi:alpha/beta hydrolase [soil metagenome]
MELNLTQRIAVKYYSTKFRLLLKFSPQRAVSILLQSFFTPHSTHRKDERPAIFHKAESLSFVFNGFTIRGARWLSKQSTSKTILICHGMNSCSYRFESYIQLLLNNHFNVVAFDAQGHGQSEGKILNALIYSEIILEAEKLYGSFYGIIAHSLGGMATSFAMEKLQEANKKIVLIAPATETATAIDLFFKILRLSAELRNIFDAEILRVRKLPVSWYSTARAIQNFKGPVLWLHDTDDKVCLYKDTLPVQELKSPNMEFITTSGLGHNQIYRDATVQKTIISFLLA